MFQIYFVVYVLQSATSDSDAHLGWEAIMPNGSNQ